MGHVKHLGGLRFQAQVNQKQGQGGGCETGNTSRLAKREWPRSFKALDHFVRQAVNRPNCSLAGTRILSC